MPPRSSLPSPVGVPGTQYQTPVGTLRERMPRPPNPMSGDQVLQARDACGFPQRVIRVGLSFYLLSFVRSRLVVPLGCFLVALRSRDFVASSPIPRCLLTHDRRSAPALRRLHRIGHLCAPFLGPRHRLALLSRGANRPLPSLDVCASALSIRGLPVKRQVLIKDFG